MIVNKSKWLLFFFVFYSSYNITYGQKQIFFDKKIPIVIKLCDKSISSEIIRIDVRGKKTRVLRATTKLSKNKKETWLIVNKKNIDDELLRIYVALPHPYHFSVDEISLEHLFLTDTILVEIVKPEKRRRRVKFIALISFLSKNHTKYAGGFFTSVNSLFKELPKKYKEEIKECMKKKS